MTSQESVAVASIVRPRRHGWGDQASRRAMSETAESLRRLTGFDACAIEVLRSDDMLEFVALATDNQVTRSEYDGAGSPLSAMYPALELGVEVGVLRFVRSEDMTPEAIDRMRPYGVFPAVQPGNDPTRWHAEDMLIAQVCDDQDKMRALVYFDEPRDCLRPTLVQLTDLERAIQQSLRGILVQIEREEFAQRIRLASATRAVIRTASPHADLGELFSIVRVQCREPFRAHGLWIDTLDALDRELGRPIGTEGSPELGPEVRAALGSAMVSAWERQAVLIIEPDRVWGDDDLDAHFRDQLTPQVTARGLREIALVPIGAGADALAMLAVARDVDAPRWTDDESSAALDVAHDLGRAILNAQANAREWSAVAALRELGDYRRTLIESVARELQNPLALVSGHLDLLVAMDLPADAQRSVVPMIRNTARLTALAQDLSLVSRLADSASPMSTATLELAGLLTEAIAVATPQAEHRDVSIELSVTGGSSVQGHPLELSRCIGALLDNAVKYSHRGGVVEVDLSGDGDVVALTVRDHGIGISSTDQELLFGEFFRSADPAAMSRSGHGLGLSIVRQVLVRHGGTVSVVSTRAQGATFQVLLPAAGGPPLTPPG